jgi:hypothetical protein
MWWVVTFAFAAPWLFFGSRGARLDRTIDRVEFMVLRPLGLSYLGLTALSAVLREWPLAGVSLLAFLVNGMLGASLHPAATVSELAAGAIEAHQPQGEPSVPRGAVTRAEARTIAKVQFGTAFVIGMVGSTALLVAHWKWFLAVPAAFAGGHVVAILMVLAAAFRTKPRGTRNSA